VIQKRLNSQFILSLEEVEMLCDPFQRECQAYSRIDGNHKIAVRCYGYVMFPIGHKDFSRFINGLPLRGLVKELIPDSVPHFTLQQVGKMEADFKTLLEMGIEIFNIRPEKYGGGRARDLSESFTAPNWIR
jgi:Kinetochore Sim4 complex subunit FTA2